MRETEKIFINNKFCGYGFKRNHQERVVNRTSTNDTTNTTEIIHKLGQLEDIEDKLGIDLITYFKIKNAKTVFVKELGRDVSEMIVRNSKDGIDACYKGFVNIPECDSYLRLKDIALIIANAIDDGGDHFSEKVYDLGLAEGKFDTLYVTRGKN